MLHFETLAVNASGAHRPGLNPVELPLRRALEIGGHRG